MTDLIIRDGTSQEDRLRTELQEGYIDVDEMSFESLLSMSAEYGRIIHFYNLDNEKDGKWSSLFTTDETVIYTMILCADIERLEKQFLKLFAYTLENGSIYDLALYNYVLAEKIDFWLKKLGALHSPTSKTVHHEIEKIISKKLLPELHSLGDITSRYKKADSKTVEFEKFEAIWLIQYDKAERFMFPETRLPFPSKKAATRKFLKANFYSFFNSIDYLKKSTLDLLAGSLNKQLHNPAISLYIAFLKLFQKTQKSLNRFTQRHLDFYYKDILKFQPRKFVPDSTYLIFHPTLQDKEILIKKDTEFTAGIDEHNKNLIYTANNDQLVYGAQVRSLYTLYLERDSLSAPENKLKLTSDTRISDFINRIQNEHLYVDDSNRDKQFTTAVKLNQIPLLCKNNSVKNEGLKAHPLFGAAKCDTEQQFFEDAKLGFALSSPVLLLKEGQRHINIIFKIENSSDIEKQDTSFRDAFFNYFLDGYLGPKKQDTLFRDAFFKVFRHMFKINLTTENGWYEVDEYLPLSDIIEEDVCENCLKIEIQLPPDVDPVVPYSPEIHGGQYDADQPLICFIIRPEAYVYPYSLLKDITITEIQIDVDVKGVRDVLIYNNLGQLDPGNPFNPFGPSPSLDSYFLVGNYETAQKDLTGFDVEVEWGNLPPESESFEEFYQAYDMPFDNNVFKVNLSVLRGGRWRPYEEHEQSKIMLFQSDDKYDLNYGKNCHELDKRHRIRKKNTLQCQEAVKFFQPIEKASTADSFAYNSLSKDGFFKFTLTDPYYAFGHKDYPLILSRVLTENSRLKNPRLARRVPNPPYTPLINNISINYKAVSTISLKQITSLSKTSINEKILHIHPLGYELLSQANHRDIMLLPQYELDGNLLIGLSAREFTGMLTLFFHLREDSTHESSAEPSQFTWYYLSSNQWKRLDTSHVISDTTNGFLSSGIVTINIPRDINRDNTIMPGDLFWLRVSVDDNPERPCSIYSVYTQAMKVNWQDRENSLSHLKTSLPARTIKDSRIAIPGITKIDQIVDSFGGRATESGEELRTRISERLKHKNRAVVPWDYERLILDRFPEIFMVKCFANMVAKPEPKNRLRPGHILIVVMPCLKEQQSINQKPMVNSFLLSKIKEFVKGLASPFAEIEVRNPTYELIQVRCTVKFSKEAEGTGYYINKLNQDISDYLSPWNKTGYRVRFGWCIRRYNIMSYINTLVYIDFVTDFSMLRITNDCAGYFQLFDTVSENADGEEVNEVREIGPLHPWSIAIPISRHYIKTMDKVEDIQPEITGIDELEICNTFIIN